VSAPANRPYDLVDQIEMVEKQPLIIHEKCVLTVRLSVAASLNTSAMKRNRERCHGVQGENLARLALFGSINP
jgi:hypothetical protein